MRSTSILVSVALLVAGCTSTVTTSSTAPGSTAAPPTTTASTTTTSSSTTTTTTITTTTTTTIRDSIVAARSRQPRPVAPFAAFRLVPMDIDGSYPGPDWPASLDNVVTPPDASYLLEDADVAKALTERGFVVIPGYRSLFQDAYGTALYDNHAMFVTTDAGYHFLHLAFSKVLRDTEEASMLPVLEDLVTHAVETSRDQATELKGTELADVASRVQQLFEAAAVLLGLDVGSVGPRAEQEVALALEAARMTTSPITGFVACDPAESPRGCVDYSLFEPRGHYTRSEDLERYFRAMSLLGQEGASFVAVAEDGTLKVNVPSMQFSLLLARAMETDSIEDDWRLVYEPTAFMVGVADDYTPYELASVAGPNWSMADAADPAFIQRIGEGLLASRSVGVNPEAASVRVMGARFVIDSYVLDQLAWPNVGEGFPVEKRRVYVSPLDVAAAFGSEYALDVQHQAGESRYSHYDDQMSAMRDVVASRSDEDWAATVYDAWLAALQPVLRDHGAAFPQFMRSDAWTAKDLQTALGSYTELKHDTILYGKQEFAAEGGGDWSDFPPRHWVEPEPVAFERMSEVAALLRNGLRDRGLLPDANDRLLAELQTFLDRLARIARDELAGKAITDADNDWLGEIGSVMERLWYQSADVDTETGAVSDSDSHDALVADIARSTSWYLEIGDGYVDTILVLVPADNGRFQVAIGGVYSYYEFWRPAAGGRLTDEEWWAMLQRGDAPDRRSPLTLPDPEGGTRERPAWQATFLVPLGR